MITDVHFSSSSLSAGDTLSVNVNAKYPIIIEIYCFVTHPEPPKFVPCPDNGKHTLQTARTFVYRTSQETFAAGGYLDLTITDADFDSRHFTVNVDGLNRPLALKG